ncbi:MAG: hypothetical protein V5A88_00820 [Candidatus Thermoplasmatota archaeon]
MKVKTRLGALLVVVFLILSGSLLSGCTSNEERGVVGIPKGEDAEGDFYREENRAEIFVPILNTYKDPKEIVVKYQVITEKQNRYSELKKIRLPETSEEVYSQEIHVPEGEVAEFFDAEIIVSEDDIGIVKVRGERVDDEALINATVANTNFDSKEATLNFEAVMEEGNVEWEKKDVTLPKNSIDEYSQRIRVDGTVEDYRVEIVE